MRIFLLSLFAFGGLQSTFAAESTSVEFDRDEQGQMQILVGDEQFATYVWQNDEIPRPYFANIQAPGGKQVTRSHPPDPEADVADHPAFHPGLWLTFGDLSGSDYWRNKANTEYVEDSLRTTSRENAGQFQARFQYRDQQDPQEVVCQELFRCRIVPRNSSTLLVWDSTFTGDEPFHFGDQEEMGLGVRVNTRLRSEDRQRGTIAPGTGKIEDAKGRINGDQVWGTASRWCDYSGTIDGKHVGVTLFCHPDNPRPSWFHARDYGLLVANLFGREAFDHGEPSRIEVAPGEEFRLRYGLLFYALAEGESPDFAAVYQDYLQQAKEIE